MSPRHFFAAWLLVLGAASARAEEPPMLFAVPQNDDDTVGTEYASGELVIEVTSPRGAGTAELRLIDGAWPGVVRLRFAGFNALESLRAIALGRVLRCAPLVITGGPALHPCSSDGQKVGAVSRTQTGFEVLLPADFPPAGASMSLEWVERWRR